MMKRVMSFVLVAAMMLGMFAAIPIQAQAATDMKVSDAIIEYVKSIEGFRATPYWDHSQWTIGFGSRCPEEDLERYKKEGIPMAEAHALLANKLNGYGNSVKDFAKKNGLELNQNQFDALVSFTYNLGTAWMYTPGGTMYDAVVKGYVGNEFIAAISAYCNASGEYMGGLMRRRLTEANIYLNGHYGKYSPSNYCNVRYDANGGSTTATAQGYDCNLYAVPTAKASYAGYVFQGWYTDPTGGVRITMLDENTDGMTLYAHWAESGQDGTELPMGVEVTVTASKVNVRRGPGLSYSIVGSVKRGEVLVITKTHTDGNMLWGKFEEGWLALSYTTYEEKNEQPGEPGTVKPPVQEKVDVSMPQVPTKATVVATEEISVYNGPHSTYPVVGKLKQGQVITIVEIFDMLGTKWGRFDGGWLKMKGNLQFDNFTQLAHSFTLKITDGSVPVRCGPGTDYVKLSTVYKGDVLTITAVVNLDNGQVWGQHAAGWTRIDGRSDYDSSKLPQYQSHDLGEWYAYKAPTCAQKGQERRDCELCKHYEIRETVYADHSYGAWREVEPGTCVTPGVEQRSCNVCGDKQTRNGELGSHSMGAWAPSIPASCISEGQERRECQYCDYFETQKTGFADHTFGAWTVIQAPTATELGQERRECTLCGHFEVRDIVPTEHVYGEWYIVKEPTCTENGEARRTCIHCDAFERKRIQALDHDFGEWTETLAPTCVAEGEQTRVCSRCQEEQKRPVEAGAHVVSNWYSLTRPSCSTIGMATGTCNVCGQSQIKTIEPIPHTYGEWTEVTPPSCGVPGEQVRSCSVCGYEDKQPVVGQDHQYGMWTILASATCTTPGERIRRCQNCGYVDMQPIDVKEHAYGEWTVAVAPSCNAAGERFRTCESCGDVQKETLEATSHTYGEWIMTTAPTCTMAGEQTSTCALCGDVQKQNLEIIDHTYGEWTVTTEPTCTAVGEQTSSCSMCGDTHRLAIDPIDHIYGEWSVTVQPTCNAAGEQTSSCSMCGDTKRLVLEPIAHVYGDWIVSVQPSCNAAGEQTSSCSVCGDIKHMPVDPIDHVYGEWLVITNPSCTAVGEKASVCSMCGDTIQESIPMLEHVLGNWETYIDPSCTQPGEARRSCKTCDHYESREIPAIEHVYGAWNTVVEASCVAEGQQIRECTACGTVQSQTLPRKDHVMGQWQQILAPTYTEVGQERRDCQNCDLFEVRSIPCKENDVIVKVYATISCDALTIRKGPGTSYGRVGLYYKGKRVEILDQKIVGDKTWGQTDKGWICLTGYVTLETVEVEIPDVVVPSAKVYATVTCDALSIRKGPGTSYSRVGLYYKGKRVEILEQRVDGDMLWGKTDKGWICLTGFVTLETVQENSSFVQEPEQTTGKTYATVTCSALTVRENAGTSYARLGLLHRGDRVEILDQVMVGSAAWGKTESGWICLTGYTNLETENNEEN